MQRYSARDIIVLVAIGALFVLYFGRSMGRSIEEFVLFILALIVAVTFHECAHAFVALRLGDATGKLLGRVSLNPIRHLDLFGSLAFLFVGFGWGKPVPVNPYNMRGVSPAVGYALSALAGPASNVLLAFLVTVPFRLELISASMLDPYTLEFVNQLLLVNVLLAAFNFLPIPPLDGFSLARLVLPRHITGWLEQYGMFILIALVFLPQFFGRQFDLLRVFTTPIQTAIWSLIRFGM